MGNVVAIGGGFDIEPAHEWKLARYIYSLSPKGISELFVSSVGLRRLQ